jgi:hypothetical protein
VTELRCQMLGSVVAFDSKWNNMSMCRHVVLALLEA